MSQADNVTNRFNDTTLTKEQMGQALVAELYKGFTDFAREQGDKMDRARVLRLIEAGAALECTDSNGRTPLLLAVDMGDREVAKKLIDAGANVAAVDYQGKGVSFYDKRDARIAKQVKDNGP